MFKKIVVLAMAIVCILTLSACKQTENSTDSGSQVPEVLNPTVSLSNAELEKMNIFLSNFLETSFTEYSSNTRDDFVIEFAIRHSSLNYPSRKEVTNDSLYKIKASYITDDIQRFFGKSVTLKSVGEYTYRDSAFYFPAADGETYHLFAQVDQCTENSDGTYNVTFSEYDFSGNDGIDFDKKAYQPKSIWSSAIAAQCTVTGQKFSAQIKKATVNGTEVYQLITLIQK